MTTCWTTICSSNLKHFFGLDAAAIVTVRSAHSSGSNGFFNADNVAGCKSMPIIIRYANEISAMKAATDTVQGTTLAWAVLSQNQTTGRSEVVKVTGHEEADAFVQNNPDVYYKSGPFVV